MWLLSTARAELKFFPHPEDVPGGYAILSHVWLTDGEEDSFQKVQSYSQQMGVPNAPSLLPHNPAGTSTVEEPQVTTDSELESLPLQPVNPRDLVSPKLRGFLELSVTYGYEWAWVDTCCIDKTSSADLTEAINSMFTYYSLSDVCFAYLSDFFDDFYDKHRFSISWWHCRGWTLQELLAPRNVVFVSRTWCIIGNKYDIASDITFATGIPESVLRFEKDITDTSVIERMSWTSGRLTTRPEDQAYCLFGLFGVRIPTLYGEGSANAFYRLQEEIMKTSFDTSLFAWETGSSLEHSFLAPGISSLDEITSALSSSPGSDIDIIRHNPENHMLSPSLRKFRWKNIRSMGSRPGVVQVLEVVSILVSHIFCDSSAEFAFSMTLRN